MNAEVRDLVMTGFVSKSSLYRVNRSFSSWFLSFCTADSSFDPLDEGTVVGEAFDEYVTSAGKEAESGGILVDMEAIFGKV